MSDATSTAPSGDEPAPPDEATLLLARASRVLAGSLDLERTLERVVDLLVPEHAAWAQLTLPDGAGGQEIVCRRAAGGDVEHLHAHAPQDDGPFSVGGVVATGRRAEVSALTPDHLAGIVAPEEIEGCAPLVGRPAAILPLEARGSVYGTLSLLGLEGSRPLQAVRPGLVRQASLAVDAARLHHERSRIAAVLQRGLRPPVLPEIPGVRVAGFFRPADESAGVGGDFYDLHGASDDWTVVLGDVAGKGVEAAMMTGAARQSIRTAAMVDRAPAHILGLLNRVLITDESSEFVTVVCGRLRPAPEGAWRFDVAAAGHPPPFVLRADGEVATLGARGTVVGALPDLSYEEVTVTLRPGDACLLFTDGVTESRDMDGELFGRDRIAALLAESRGADPGALVEHVARTSIDFGKRGRDDIAMLALRVEP